MKQKLMRKTAEAKSALVSKEAAMSSTEIVILILFVVIIAIAVGVAVKGVVVGADGSGGVVKTANDKITSGVTKLEAGA